ncbi:MAG: amino acid ABC transporter permease [Candidatus Dormiibacterota bacterium]
MTDITASQLAPAPSEHRHPEAIRAVPLRHPWRWVSAVVVLALFAAVVYTFATAPLLKWPVVGQYLFNDRVMSAVLVTLALTVIAMLIGVSLGLLMAVMRQSANPVMRSVSWFYIWFFRGTPVLVQIFFWFNIAFVLPFVKIGIPLTGLQWVGQVNNIDTPFIAAILGLGLNEAAYMAEIIRAGLISVDAGQTEAAQALGMTRAQVMRRVVIPQAMRVIIPPTGNETISMLKTSSLAFICAVGELFFIVTEISNANYRIVELLIVASVWYLLLTSVLTLGQYYLERYFARGSVRNLPMTPLQRLRRLLPSHSQYQSTAEILAEVRGSRHRR